MIVFNSAQIFPRGHAVRSVISTWTFGSVLALAASGALAQSGFAELAADTRETALSALTEIEKNYYKEVSRTALLDACVRGMVEVAPHSQAKHPDDDETDRCLRNMVMQLDKRAKYFNLQEAVQSHNRHPVPVAPVSNTVLANNVMLIGIPAVADSTPQQLADALDVAKSSKSRGIIVDLRGNDDDHFLSAAVFASAFLPAKTRIAIAKSPKSGGNEELFVGPTFWTRNGDMPAKLPGIALSTPLVVLVDDKTRGTGEILAAVLQDQQRALIVGRQTAGSTEFQMMNSVTSGGFFALPQGTFVRSSGLAIDGKGVMPDRIVPVEKDIETAMSLLR